MSTTAELMRPETPAEQERHASYLELFFDLVFVFAITQVTALALDDSSAGGLARAALVLGLLWWTWGGYAWLTNAIDVENVAARGLVMIAMAGTFFMALAVPHAYDVDGAWFAVPYFAVRVLHVAIYTWGLRDDPDHQRAVKRLAPFFLVAPLIALGGGLVEDETLRTWIWVGSLALDLFGALTVGSAGFRVSAAHFAERYGLFVIIALGESIVAIGVGATGIPHDLTFAVAVVIAFAGVVALWWSHFDFSAVAAERALRRADPVRRAPLARDVYSYFHYPAILGIVFYAVAAEKTVAHPEEPLSEGGRAALGLGIALFLMTATLGRFRVIRRIAWERLAGAAAAIAAVLLFADLDAMWLLALVVALLAAVTVAESARLREIRGRLRAEAD